eukprot:7367005-Pyramimonas_sp.AAC.1
MHCFVQVLAPPALCPLSAKLRRAVYPGLCHRPLGGHGQSLGQQRLLSRSHWSRRIRGDRRG